MKIVITGALGHIGSKLIRTLPEQFPGAEFTLIDNLSVQRYCSLFDLPKNVKYSFFEEDVLNANLGQHFKNASVVIHLAAITNATESFQNKDKVELENYNATVKVAEACVKNNCPLLYLSTTSVYGTQKKVVDENCSESELKPQSPYAETKLREEKFLLALSKSKGLKTTICRFGTIFGTSPGMRFHTAVNKFCWQAVLGTPITVWTQALNQVRPYLDLNDATNAIAFLIKKNHFTNEFYNVLTVNASVSQIVDTIKEFVPELSVKFVDSAIMNQLSYHVSSEKFQSLGFRFSGNLQKQVENTIRLLSGAKFGCLDKTEVQKAA